MEREMLEFVKWITGHDEETVIQMYNDYSNSPSNKGSQVKMKLTEEKWKPEQN